MSVLGNNKWSGREPDLQKHNLGCIENVGGFHPLKHNLRWIGGRGWSVEGVCERERVCVCGGGGVGPASNTLHTIISILIIPKYSGGEGGGCLPLIGSIYCLLVGPVSRYHVTS